MDPVTAGSVVTTIGTMAATTKTIIETIKAVRGKAKNPEVDKSLSDAIEQIFSLQTGMLDLQQKILTLHEENAKLRERIREEEERARDRKQYEEKKIGNSVVLVHVDNPDIFYCPVCFKTKKVALPLQALGHHFSFAGSHTCASCKTNFGAR